MLGDAGSLHRLIGLQNPPKLIHSTANRGHFSQGGLTFGRQMEGGTVALWDGVSGEFVNFISTGGNSFSACTVNPVSHLQFVHRDGTGQVYRVHEVRGNTTTLSGPDDANDGLVGSVRVAGANAVQGFAMNPDGASFWTLEQPTRTDATICRIRSTGEEVGSWKFAWFGSGADMAKLKGGSLAAGSDPDEVVGALPVPGGFVSCSDDGFRILESTWQAVTAGEITEMTDSRLVVQLPVLPEPDADMRFRPTVAMRFPMGLKFGSETLTVQFRWGSGDQTMEVDARTIDSSGWYLLQFDELTSSLVQSPSGLTLDIPGDQLRFSRDSSFAARADDVVNVQFVGLVPIRERTSGYEDRTIGPVSVQGDGTKIGLLDDSILLRWPQESSSANLVWSDVVNDLAHFIALSSSQSATTVTTWFGHAYRVGQRQ